MLAQARQYRSPARDFLHERVARFNVVEILDTLAFLVGDWRLERSIDDHHNATSGTFLGVSHLSIGPASTANDIGEHATYDEQGELCFGEHAGSARRRLEYRRRDDGSVSLYFLDGRYFVDLDLSSGSCEGTHHCAPDAYYIKTVARSTDRYEEHWHVVGPGKDYEATTIYSRVSVDFT